MYDSAGLAMHAHRVVAKIVTKEGAEKWSTTQARWEAWHQERPVLKARVTERDAVDAGPQSADDFPAKLVSVDRGNNR